MKPLALLILLFGTLKAFCQDWEYLQADTVYKKNHVKTCTVRFYGQEGSRIVFNLDTNGRIIDRVQFNPTGKKFYNRNIFQYNEKGKVAVVSQLIEDSLPQSPKSWTTCTYHYDPHGKLVGSQFTGSAGKVFSEKIYTYDPFTLHSKMFSPIDSTIVTCTIFYDGINVIKKNNSYREKAGKVISRWEEGL